MSKKITLTVLAFALAVALVFTGCTPARRPITTDQYNKAGLNRNVNYQNDYRTIYSDIDRNNVRSNLGVNPNVNTAAQNTDQLVRASKQVQGVRDATVVVTGNTAYVGIDLDRTRAANERDIKNEVTQRVRATDKNINTVYVSTDVSFMDRLRNVGNEIRNGRPIEGFTTELNEMFQRVTPAK